MASKSARSAVSQLECIGCGAPLSVTGAGRRVGRQACLYCGTPVRLPEEARSEEPAPARQPEGSRIERSQSGEALRFEIPPVGWSSAAAQSAIGFGLLIGTSALGALGATYLADFLWIAAALPLPIALFLGAQVLSAWTRRKIEVTRESLTYEERGPALLLALRPGKRRRAVELADLGGVAVRMIGRKNREEPGRVLLVDAGARPWVVGTSPDRERPEELEWVAQEIPAFLAELDRERASEAEAPRGREAIVERGVALRCMACGRAVRPSARSLDERIAPCSHCEAEVIVPRNLRRELAAASRRRGPAITIGLGEAELRVDIPPSGWSESAFGVAGAFFSVALALGLFAAAFFQAALPGLRAGWLAAGAASGFLALLCLKPVKPILGRVYGSVEIEMSRAQTCITRRVFGTGRRRCHPTPSVEGARLDLRPEEEETFRRLRLEIDGAKDELLAYADLGDEWMWVARELDAFRAGLAAT